MLSSFRLGTAAVAGLILAGTAVAQNVPNNRHLLNNGTDVVFIYDDPSVGFSVGSNPPDFSGTLFWQVYPRGSTIASAGTVEMSGADFGIFDTDFTTIPDFNDVVIGPGVANPATAGNIKPDFSPAGIAASTLISLGNSGLPNPCTASPGFCTGIGGTSICPPSGSVVGYEVEFQFLTPCTGVGVIFTANNTVDTCVTNFLPGGMTFATGGPGQCGIGDYTLMTEASTDETQADIFAGSSQFGGFQSGNAPGTFIADAVTERSGYQIEFCDSVDQTQLSGDVGLAGLEASVGGGGATLKYEVHDEAGVGATNLVFASACILPPFPPPGIAIFGAGVMLNLTDPSVNILLKKGVVTAGANYPFTQSTFIPAGAAFPIPIGAVGLTLSQQAITLNIPTLTGRGSNLTKTRFNP